LIDLQRSYVAAGKFHLHDFVVMPETCETLYKV
jgi:hypothetical protein